MLHLVPSPTLTGQGVKAVMKFPYHSLLPERLSWRPSPAVLPQNAEQPKDDELPVGTCLPELGSSCGYGFGLLWLTQEELTGSAEAQQVLGAPTV